MRVEQGRGGQRRQLRPWQRRHVPSGQPRRKPQPGPRLPHRCGRRRSRHRVARLTTGKRIAWSPAQWGGDQAEAYTEVAAEFRTGDRLQFTRNNRAAARNNGDTAEVVAIDAEHGRVTVAKQDGTRQTLDMGRLADRHVRHGWVRTIHNSQGATCDHVIAHLESFRANTVDAASAYVAISRARKGAAIYTDSRAKLTEALGVRDGAQVGAIDETMGRSQSEPLNIFQPLQLPPLLQERPNNTVQNGLMQGEGIFI